MAIKRKINAKPEGCIHPDCFHCPLGDCGYNAPEKSDNAYLVRMNRFRNFQKACLAGHISSARKTYPECEDNRIGVSVICKADLQEKEESRQLNGRT